jgi:hypothetical protein
MPILRVTCALVAFSSVLVAGRAADARVGVAPVVLSGEQDEELRRRVERILVRETDRLGHPVTRPADIEPQLEDFDRTHAMKTGEWVAIAHFLDLDAVVITRMKLAEGKVTLVLRVVFPDGLRDLSETAHESPPNAPYRARELLESMVGEAEPVDDPANGQQLVGENVREEHEADIMNEIRRQERRRKRGVIVAGVVAPLVLAVGVGLGSFMFYRADELEKEQQADEDFHGPSYMSESSLVFVGGIFVVGITGLASLATLIIGSVLIRRADRELRKLKPQLRDFGQKGDRVSMSVAPIIGPDGTFGAGAVVYF